MDQYPRCVRDYVRQGQAITRPVTAAHGEVQVLANGRYFLANGFRAQPSTPAAFQSFRPDYLELQFLLEYALYAHDTQLQRGVTDLLEEYAASMGTNHIHRGKTGQFDATGTAYTCTELCTPPYLDNIDTWRAIPALSGLLATHPDAVPPLLRASIFDYWWTAYAGGNPSYAPGQATPSEIFANAADGRVKSTEFSYKTLSMWMPLGVAYDATYVRTSIGLLAANYDWTGDHFYGSAYYGGYYSQFAQRALGIATGLLDQRTYSSTPPLPPHRRAVAH